MTYSSLLQGSQTVPRFATIIRIVTGTASWHRKRRLLIKVPGCQIGRHLGLNSCSQRQRWNFLARGTFLLCTRLFCAPRRGRQGVHSYWTAVVVNDRGPLFAIAGLSGHLRSDNSRRNEVSRQRSFQIAIPDETFSPRSRSCRIPRQGRDCLPT